VDSSINTVIFGNRKDRDSYISLDRLPYGLESMLFRYLFVSLSGVVFCSYVVIVIVQFTRKITAFRKDYSLQALAVMALVVTLITIQFCIRTLTSIHLNVI